MSLEPRTRSVRTVRVLLTDGKRTAELYWLAHKPSGVYYGTPLAKFRYHSSYHASGKRHWKVEGTYERMPDQVPLAELKGRSQLTGFGFNSSILSAMNVPHYQGSRSRKGTDALVVLDSRTMPKNHTVNVHVALIEPHNSDALLSGWLPGIRQLVVLTSVEPWVEVATAWD